tara:strand:- start:1737 stop:2120 length:384 start_codon:yes stop_codon:yes gene_type:complete
MTERLSHNHFQWVLSIQDTFSKFVKNEITIRQLANDFCMLGAGRKFLDDNTLAWPEDRFEQEFNEIIHAMCVDYGVLGILRGHFAYDTELSEDHSLKIATKPYDKDLVDFLAPKPDPRYFSSDYCHA